MSVSQSAVHNILLRTMDSSDFDGMAPSLELIELKPRDMLLHEQRIIDDVFFPESGICSVLAVSQHREIIETSMFGREGMTDMVCDVGHDIAPMRIIVQSPGEAWRVPARVVARASATSTSFLKLALRYQQTVTSQAAYTALSHGSYSVPERLARWLLMCQDRLGDEFPIVHDWIAMMLAVRRAGVTDATHVLEGASAIRATRGRVKITNRFKLTELANGSYGVPEMEYERLIGDFGRAPR